MNITSILQELRAESDRIERAITAILGIGSDGVSRSTTSAPKKRRMSAGTRRRLSLLMKKRWAQGKMKGRAKAHPNAKKTAPKPTAARKASRNGGMSTAARKRLSDLLKKRWASGKMGKRRKAKVA